MGIYKSADGMQSVGAVRPATGFPAWPASAIGRQVAVGAQSAVSGDDALLVVRSELGSSPQTYERETATLSGGVWTKQEDGASVAQDPIEQVKKLGNYHYRLEVEGATVTFSSATGQLQRSIDEGLTWSDVGPAPKVSGGFDWGVSDMAIGADGVLWLCATSVLANTETDFEPEIYKSSDEGATWDFVWQEAVNLYLGNWLHMWSIACHPTDEDIIVVAGDTGIGNGRTWNTQTGGSPFTYEDGSAGQSVSRQRYLVVLDNSRICAVLGVKAIVSDDFGDTAWVEKEANLVPGGTWLTDFIRGKSGHMFTCGYGASVLVIMRSTTYGETWAQIVSEDDFPALTPSLSGLVYDAPKDILYIATVGTANLRVFALDTASTVLAADVGSQTLRNISLNLDDLFTTEQIAARGIALK